MTVIEFHRLAFKFRHLSLFTSRWMNCAAACPRSLSGRFKSRRRTCRTRLGATCLVILIASSRVDAVVRQRQPTWTCVGVLQCGLQSTDTLRRCTPSRKHLHRTSRPHLRARTRMTASASRHFSNHFATHFAISSATFTDLSGVPSRSGLMPMACA